MWQLIVTCLTVVFMLLLPFLLPKYQVQTYSDEELRQTAMSRGMKPTPSDSNKLAELLYILDSNISSEKIELGKELFFDTTLSLDKTMNCSSCHMLNQGGDDNQPTAIGYQNRENPFHLNSPTVLNAALAKSFFWNGRAKSLEDQAGGPIQAHFEMNLTPQELLTRLNNTPKYKTKFAKAFKQDEAISFDNVRSAIASYERTLITHGAYDRFLEGDNSAINEKAKKGFAHFINLGCKGCHTGMSVGGQSMQQFPLRTPVMANFNIEFSPSFRIVDTSFPFENKGGFLGADNKKLFRVPILRNVTKTAPYFHNGAVKELKDAVKIMALYQLGVKLSDSEIDEIVEFLKTLEGDIVGVQ